MPRHFDSLRWRSALVLIGVHLLWLPVLAWGLLSVVEQIQDNAFIEYVRTVTRSVADALEVGDALEHRDQAALLLDSIVLNGQGVYAELIEDGQTIRSSLNRPGLRYPGQPDLSFGSARDGIYFVVLPIGRDAHVAELRLGFDTSAALDAIRTARRTVLAFLLIYAVASIGLAIWLVGRIVQPIARLQRLARAVVSGSESQSLTVRSGIHEVAALGADLEQMRAALVGSNERLRHEIAQHRLSEERRAALEQTLRRRQRLETVGTLAGGVAHEINNSLLPIMLYTQMVLDRPDLDATAREDLEGVLRAARGAKQIVQQVLTFSRQLDEEHYGRIDLSGPVAEALRLFRALAPPNVTIDAALAADIPLVRGDPTLVGQLVMNLCTNAMQAMRDTGGVLQLRLQRHDASGADPRVAAGVYVELTVRDTGQGMDALTVERMFEPFFTTRPVGAGSGLGLSVVHGIARSMGAIVQVASTPGSGTCVSLLFPQDRAASSAAEAADASTR